MESANAVSFADWGERGGCASDVRWRHIVLVRKELRNGSNKSEHELTGGRSTNYGSGHLVAASVAFGAPLHSYPRWQFPDEESIEREA